LQTDIANGAVTAAKLDSVGAGAGNPPVYGCRAWVQFSGVTASNGLKDFTNNTARLIRGQGNVSSVIRNNTGDYTITFAIPMPNNAYAVVVGGQGNVTQSNNTVGGIYPRPGTAWGVGSPPPADAYDNHTTNSVRVFTDNGANARFDADLVTVAIFC
jgi:hypothetical protein